MWLVPLILAYAVSQGPVEVKVQDDRLVAAGAWQLGAPLSIYPVGHDRVHHTFPLPKA